MSFHSVESLGWTAGGIRYRTNVIVPHATTPAHAHDSPYFCAVLDGVSTQTSGGAERRRDRGRAYFPCATSPPPRACIPCISPAPFLSGLA